MKGTLQFQIAYPVILTVIALVAIWLGNLLFVLIGFGETITINNYLTAFMSVLVAMAILSYSGVLRAGIFT